MYAQSTMIESWCERQLNHWRARAPRYRSTVDEFEHLNATQGSIFLYRLQDGVVTLLDKPGVCTRDDVATRGDLLVHRALLYRDFLQQVVAFRRPRGAGLLALGTHDGPFESETSPIFAFHKLAGSPAVLLNDADFITNRFYPRAPCGDPYAYGRKLTKAVFVGSTTGALHTEESVARLSSPRLRSGVAFRDSAEVDFKLPIITQCATDAAAEHIRALGFGEGAYDWGYQFGYKFMISMDGNGATWARNALALKSRSVLLKYDSPYELYYSGGLIPWLHYIPIGSDQQVIDIVRMERDRPGRFRYVGEEGRAFYRRYLTRRGVMTYVSRLIETYFSVFA